MLERPYRVVCFIARNCGYNLLQHLVRQPRISVIAVFTHSKKPSAEDPNREERPEFARIRETARMRGIPLHVIDYAREAKAMTAFEEIGEFDFLLSLSWRFLVPPHVLGRALLADINLHRGLLPKYGGAEPVRRMLEDGLKHATITAHLMEDTIDTGEVLQEDHLEAQILPSETAQMAAERIKTALDPLYPFTAIRAMNKILQRKGLPLLDLEGPSP